MPFVSSLPAREVAQPSAKITRPSRIAGQVVIVGGLPGCGKTMMTPIVGSLARVELQKFNYVLEHVCALRLLHSLEDEAATALIRLVTDLDLYNLAMSREVNLRPTDLSSIFKNPGTWRYLRRLVQPGDAAAAERIRQERLILHLTIHNPLVLCPPLFTALGEAVRFVEVVRHPLHMLRAWRFYIERYGTDPRDFTLWIDFDGRSVPYFAQGWEEQYLQANLMDRSIYTIAHLMRTGRQHLEQLSDAQRGQVLLVPFERFVLEPWPYLAQLEAFLGTHRTPQTRRVLKQQRVPRARVTAGVALDVYRQNGWLPPEQDASERRELEKRRAYAAQEASPEALDALDRLCEEYATTHLSGLEGWT